MRQELLEKGRGGLLVTGSCSEGEHFTYNQNGAGMIGESCVTAYMLRWLDSLLRLEGDMHYGDIMERTIYNALFAANSPDGRHIRYFTPFTGEREYDLRDCFCCCGNYRRAIGELPAKVVYRTPEGGIVLNLYTNMKKTFTVAEKSVTLQEKTAYPNNGDVTISVESADPLAFPLSFRVPHWCEKVTVKVNEEVPIELASDQCEKGLFTLRRTWKTGDVVRISMPMEWRLVRGRAVQEGHVALMRGPVVFGFSKEQNAELLKKFPQPRDLVVDPKTIGVPEPDTHIRPDGQKVRVKAWTNPECTGEQVEVVYTEFTDPADIAVYFKVPNLNDTQPIRLMDDELFFMQ